MVTTTIIGIVSTSRQVKAEPKMSRASTLFLFLVVANWNESVGFIFKNTRSTVKRSAALNIAPIKNVEAFMGVDTTIRENDSKLNFPLNKNKFDGNVDMK